MEVNEMTNAELLTVHRSIAANTSQWELVMAAETELLRRLEHGQGAQWPPRCIYCNIDMMSPMTAQQSFCASGPGHVHAAPPEQPQGSGEHVQGCVPGCTGVSCDCSCHCWQSAGLADRREALEWERNIHEQLDTLGAPRKSVDGFDFSINGRFAFLRYRAADPAQGQMSAREAAQKLLDSPEWNTAPTGGEMEIRLLATALEAFARSQGEEKNG